jgi:hypothetical protein
MSQSNPQQTTRSNKEKRDILINIILVAAGLVVLILVVFMPLLSEPTTKVTGSTIPPTSKPINTLIPSRTIVPSLTTTTAPTTTSTPLPVSQRLVKLCTTDEEHVSLSYRGHPLQHSTLLHEPFYDRYPTAGDEVWDAGLGDNVTFCINSNSIITTHSTRSSPDGPDLVTFNVANVEDNVYSKHIWLVLNARNTSTDDRDKKLAVVSVAFPGYHKRFELKLGQELADWTDGDHSITRYTAANVVPILHLNVRDFATQQRSQLLAVRLDIPDRDPIQAISIEDISQRELNNPTLALDIIALTIVKSASLPTIPTPVLTPTASANTLVNTLCMEHYYREQSRYISRRSFMDVASSGDPLETGLRLADSCEDRDRVTLVQSPNVPTEVPFVLYRTGPVLETWPEDPVAHRGFDSAINLDLTDGDMEHVTRIYLLMSARNLCVRQNIPEHVIRLGDRIGRIVVSFEDGYTLPVFPLEAGLTIRQSRTPDECGNNRAMREIAGGSKYRKDGMLITASALRVPEVRQGITEEYTSLQLDLVTLTVPEYLRDKRLISIEIVDDTRKNREASTQDFYDPFITLYGVTLEHEQ